MKTRRSNFTDPQRADIFVRDRATCAFSGISLWVFDHGVSPWTPMDWVDHVVPCALGGTATLDNGVCATHMHNGRKGSSGLDSWYLFRNGRPTALHVTMHGLPGERMSEALTRRAALERADWYLNRALYNAFIGLDWRFDVEFLDSRPKRDDEYWFRSARRRLADYRRRHEGGSIEARGLLPPGGAHGNELLLGLRTVETDAQFGEWVEALWPVYRANEELVHRVGMADRLDEQRELLERASDDRRVNPAVVAGLIELCDRDHERLVLPGHED